MQVCQSIRSEFRPLYLAHKNVVVHNAIAFLNAFHPLKGEAKPCGKLSLIVEFPGPEHTDLSHIPPPLVGVFDTSVYQPIDLCQLFYQCDIARAIQPNFRAANGSYYEDNSYRCVAWLNFLNNA